MCHQSVGLIQSIIEKAGIPTASVTLLREITERVAPPRALFANFPLGYPLGEPNNSSLQTMIILATLELLAESTPPGIIRDLSSSNLLLGISGQPVRD
jgi:D-proline reductase (dithiol) PrdB